MIEAAKSNGTFHTTGSVTYVSVGSVNSQYGSTYVNNIQNLTPVIIHTPAYCEVVAKSDNAKYIQLLHPIKYIQAVLDEKSVYNDFTINIVNTGFHTDKLGYKTRDYSYSLRSQDTSYIKKNKLLRNEVNFPFDVYLLQNGEY
jgi:hypothetical protein